MRLIGLAALTLCLTTAAAPAPMRILIASDSTAQDYKPDRYPQSGWGTMLRCAVAPGVTVENFAIGGRSTGSFIREGRLDRIAATIRAGDTLLIQFGHNDASVDKPERFTAVPDYVANLRRFVKVATDVGARAVILTPVARRDFRDGVEQPSFPTYAEAARETARATGTPLIDLGATSRAMVARLGADAAKAYYLHYQGSAGLPGFPQGVDDDTHFSELGARRVADLVATDLHRLGLPVSRHVRPHVAALTRATPRGGATCG